ncbi:MAG: leucine-rich repeat domain-containing protein [Alistipes sp.]|nr:leucine-rich repeat domain-containing protein [Alistipes sp.]
MKRLLPLFVLLGLLATSCSKDMFDDLKNWVDNLDGGSNGTIPNNEIWYTNGSTKDATEPYDVSAFDVDIVSNTYNPSKNCWVIKFDGEVKSIGEYAFYGRTELTSVTIPCGVTSIESASFALCTDLKKFVSEFASVDGRTLIVDGNLVAFAPAGLSSYTTPGGVVTIDDCVFSNCYDLESIVISDGVLSIGDSVFNNSHNLTSVVLPATITEIGDTAFAYCMALTDISIPNRVTSIGSGAFAFCNSLTAIKIADSVTSLGNNVFEGCQELESVVLGNGITAIPNYAFFKCDKLSNVVFGDNVTTIGELAFKYCMSLTSITIPETVVAIGERVFRVCLNLERVYCKAITPPTAVVTYDGWMVFDDNAVERRIYVPTASVEAYKLADGWIEYANSIVGYNFEKE